MEHEQLLPAQATHTACTISFEPEAYEWAEDAYGKLKGCTVRVVTRDDSPDFLADIGPTRVDPVEGTLFVLLFVVVEPDARAQRGPGEHERRTGETKALDIYTDIESITVL